MRRHLLQPSQATQLVMIACGLASPFAAPSTGVASTAMLAAPLFQPPRLPHRESVNLITIALLANGQEELLSCSTQLPSWLESKKLFQPCAPAPESQHGEAEIALNALSLGRWLSPSLN